MNIISFISQNTNAIIALILIVVFIGIIIVFIKMRKERPQVVVVNNAKNEENEPEMNDEEHKKYYAELPNEIMEKMFGMVAVIKRWILAIVIAIPLYIVGYIVAGYFALIAIPLSLVILYWAAAHWVKVEGIRLIYDGDIDPNDPKQGVEHIDYIIPFAQWKMLAVSDIGGSYPIQSLDGPAYRIERIEFWDANEKIVKKVWFSWLHANDSNFENKHTLFHLIAEWLKDSLYLNTAYEELMEILTFQKAKDIHRKFENAQNIAMSRPIEANERIAKILGEIKETKKEIKKIEKQVEKTQDMPWVEKEPESEGESAGGENE